MVPLLEVEPETIPTVEGSQTARWDLDLEAPTEAAERRREDDALVMRDMVAASFCTTGWTPDGTLRTSKLWKSRFAVRGVGWRAVA